jgi:hypothetical protein
LPALGFFCGDKIVFFHRIEIIGKCDVSVTPLLIAGRQRVANADLAEPVIGYYALDLTEAGKGKPLDPMRVSLTADKSTLIVDQLTRQSAG